MIRFRINRGSGVPAYLQVVTQTVEAVRSGHLRSGDQLPTLREVVLATGMNPRTPWALRRRGRPPRSRHLRPTRRRDLHSTRQPGLRARLVEWTKDALNSGLPGAIAGALMAEVAESGMSVVMSSHVVAELEHTCDHVVVVRAGSVALAGDIEDLRRTHSLMSGPASESAALNAWLMWR